MNNKELCTWLRSNSSGVYRPCVEAASRLEILETALFEIACLPSSREDEAHVLAITALNLVTGKEN